MVIEVCLEGDEAAVVIPLALTMHNPAGSREETASEREAVVKTETFETISCLYNIIR